MSYDHDTLVAATDLGALIEEVTGHPVTDGRYACPVRDHRQSHKTPPVTVDDGLWCCHNPSCGRGGTAVDAWMAAYSVEAGEALTELAKRAGISPNSSEPRRRIAATYDYVDQDGTLLFQVVRYEPKDFRQRRPDGNGGWIWNMQGTPPSPLSALRRAEGHRGWRGDWVPEGEKDAGALNTLGEIATTNPGGAGEWRQEYTDQLRGAAQVIVVADADDAGRKHAAEVAASRAASITVKVLEPGAGYSDIAEHLGAGLGLDELAEVDLVAEDASSDGSESGSDTREGDDQALSWAEVDLTDVVTGILDGTRESPKPTLGRLSDGGYLFYARRINALYGESGDGKSWLAHCACAQEIRAGHHVIYVDYEDNEDGTVSRLLDLGLEADDIVERFHYLRPDEPFGLFAQERVGRMLVAYHPTLVVIDSAGEAMAVDGTNPNYDDDVARWVRNFTKWIAVQGPGVLGLDHVVKDAGSRNLQPSGSHRKRDAITGAAYIVEVRPGFEFGIGRQGQARFTVSKDRAGHRVRGQVAGSFTLDATVRPYQVSLEPPEPQPEDGDEFLPTVLMERVSRHLELYAGANKKDLRTLGNSDWIDKAIVVASALRLRAYRAGRTEPSAPQHPALPRGRRDHERP